MNLKSSQNHTLIVVRGCIVGVVLISTPPFRYRLQSLPCNKQQGIIINPPHSFENTTPYLYRNLNLPPMVSTIDTTASSTFAQMDLSSDGEDEGRETAPLFTNESRDVYQPPENQITGSDGTSPLYTLFLYFMALHFLISFCEMILVAPLIKLFEGSLCFSYYNIHNPSVIGPGDALQESLCKIPEVQAPLATIRGWKSFFDTIPGTLEGQETCESAFADSFQCFFWQSHTANWGIDMATERSWQCHFWVSQGPLLKSS